MFFGPIALAIVLVTSRTFAEEFSPNDAPSGKRAPMGFQGMRGKKDVTSSENDEFAKRAPMGFQGMRGKKHSGPDIEDNSVLDEELEKRSPMGFQGMRGKKDFLTPDFADSYFTDEYFKRAPMGFQGMRGKKAIADDDYYKRAAMGFQGMRGKKSLDLLLDELENGHYGGGRGKAMYWMGYPEDYEKRAPSMGFQGMRGKRGEFEEEWEKRAQMGFQGMRGKKSLLEEMEDLEKRAMMGFQGMRGKKTNQNNYYDEYRPERSVGYFENSQTSDHELDKKASGKRKPLGFVGSRGKRDTFGSSNGYSNISPYDLQEALAGDVADDLFLRAELRDRMNNLVPLQFDKRSPLFGYFDTRGKKKIPRWEIRGKFVGVRGKKWASTTNYETGNPLNNAYNNIDRIGVKTGSTTQLDAQ